jgi:CheY-like chemotaxis protein
MKEMTGSGQVLFVEDNALAAQAGVIMLETCGYEVLHVAEARGALDQFASHDVGMVLSDISLPGGMDGIALARELRSKKPSLPIVLASGLPDNVERASSDFVVLHKPYAIADFKEAVRNAFQQVGRHG